MIETLCVKHLAKHIPIENAFILSHVVWALNHHSRPTGLVTAVFELNRPTENALRGEKVGQTGEGVVGVWPLTKAFLLFGSQTTVQNFIKIEKIATVRTRTDRQTDKQRDRQTDRDGRVLVILQSLPCYAVGRGQIIKLPLWIIIVAFSITTVVNKDEYVKLSVMYLAYHSSRCQFL